MKDIFDRTYFRPFEKSGNKHINKTAKTQTCRHIGRYVSTSTKRSEHEYVNITTKIQTYQLTGQNTDTTTCNRMIEHTHTHTHTHTHQQQHDTKTSTERLGHTHQKNDYDTKAHTQNGNDTNRSRE